MASYSDTESQTKSRSSIVKEAEIFVDYDFMTKEEADKLFEILNDDYKFKSYNLYFYDRDKKEIVSVPNWRKSYWFGDHAQAVQTCGKTVVDRDTGETVKVPTDFVMPYQWCPEMLALKDRIEKEYDVQFNSCLVGKFDDPTHKIGFHSDASEAMGEDPWIGSVSFGKSRDFKLKKQRRFCAEGEKSAENCTVTLGHGTLCVMRENANRKYLHAVPADRESSSEDCRINLTFRNYRYCPEEEVYTAS